MSTPAREAGPATTATATTSVAQNSFPVLDMIEPPRTPQSASRYAARGMPGRGGARRGESRAFQRGTDDDSVLDYGVVLRGGLGDRLDADPKDRALRQVRAHVVDRQGVEDLPV